MATETKTVKRCDVYGTTKEVETYTVCVTADNADEKAALIREVKIDLGARGLTRLLAYIDKGCCIREPKGEADAPDAT